MKILLTGSQGQVGQEFIKLKPYNYQLKSLKREDLDLYNLEKCYEYIIQYKPDWLVNCAAYTDVEGAEKDSKKTFKINSYAPKYFAKAIKEIGGKMIQISSDYVFDGLKGSPYDTDDKLNPLNVYGESKAMAESFIEEHLKSTNQFFILRTSWILSKKGKNFLKTMLKLLPNKKSISVIKDQYGCITSARSLAEVCWELISYTSSLSMHNILPSKLHWCNSGTINWFQLSLAIKDFLIHNNFYDEIAEIEPILSSQYSSKVSRPKYSVLNCSETEKLLKIHQVSWTKSLHEILHEIFFDIDEKK